MDNQYPTTLSHSQRQGQYTDLPHYSFVERYHEAYKQQFQSYAKWLNDDIARPEVGIYHVETLWPLQIR